MHFNSLDFIILFPLIFIVYWIIPSKLNSLRNFFLIFVSYLLYMNWKPAFALVLLGVTLVTYWGGQVLQLRDKSEKTTIRRKRLVWLLALLGLLPLLVFKYYNFLNESISEGLAAIGLQFAMPGLNWAVPVGISFFTFQAVGYMLDVYHGRIKAENNLFDYVLFVSFFPQVTMGPISKAEELLPQIKSSHKFIYKQGVQGLKLFLWGIFLKIVIADRLGDYVDKIYADYLTYSGSTCILSSISYTIQIYCDFAGYSLMAIGIAKLLGFNLVNNFNRPYFAISITDFWKRWHISLTRWLTQQVYIPLGGSRCSKRKNYFNIIVTFLVSGIWHGANWTFIVWGCMHGAFQIIEKKFGLQKYQGNNSLVVLLRIMTTFIIVNFAWVFFRMPSLYEATDVIIHMSTFGPVELEAMGFTNLSFLLISLLLLTIKDISDEYGSAIISKLKSKVLVRWGGYVFLGFLVVISYSVKQNFIYFQF